MIGMGDSNTGGVSGGREGEMRAVNAERVEFVSLRKNTFAPILSNLWVSLSGSEDEER